MKLNQPITRKKVVYPTKRTMNLYYKPDRTTKSATVSLYVLFALVVLLALAKLLVYDVLMDLRDKQELLDQNQRELAVYGEELKDYDQILLEYERFAATPEEMVTDRMELLALIDKAVRSTAKVDNVSISEEQMLLQFSGVTLKETAKIVQALEKSPLVASTTVNTAATTENKSRVQATILIQLVGQGESTDVTGAAGTTDATGVTEGGEQS